MRRVEVGEMSFACARQAARCWYSRTCASHSSFVGKGMLRDERGLLITSVIAVY
jgi:hypothetical protein